MINSTLSPTGFPKLTVLQIVGAGHSGSTLLGKALGCHSKIYCAGEIANLRNQLMQNSLCGCGEQVFDCPLHSQFFKAIEDHYRVDLKADPKSFSLSAPKPQGVWQKLMRRMAFSRIAGGSKSYGPYAPTIERTAFSYRTLAALTGKHVLIDTTKSGGRAYVLRKTLADFFDFKTIHLVRDGRAVMTSYGKRTRTLVLPDGTIKQIERYESQIMGPEAAAKGWVHDIKEAEQMKKLGIELPTIRYEDFTRDPEATLRQICTLLDLDYEPMMLDLTRHPVHMLGGNASRLNAKRIETPDERWRKEMTEEAGAIFARIGGATNAAYGYTA